MITILRIFVTNPSLHQFVIVMHHEFTTTKGTLGERGKKEISKTKRERERERSVR